MTRGAAVLAVLAAIAAGAACDAVIGIPDVPPLLGDAGDDATLDAGADEAATADAAADEPSARERVAPGGDAGGGDGAAALVDVDADAGTGDEGTTAAGPADATESDAPGGDASLDAGDGGGSSACSAGMLACDGGCFAATDVHNCGACGHDCTRLRNVTASISCGAGGQCQVASACAPDWAHCSQNPDDGCETDVTMPSHCGGCTTVCPATAPLCSADGGAPVCITGCGALSLCGGSCVDETSDPSNCGGCGNVCKYGLCQTSACAATFVGNGGTTAGPQTVSIGPGQLAGVAVLPGATSNLVAIGVRTSTAGATLRLGVYASDPNGLPGALVAQTSDLTSVVGATEGRIGPGVSVTAGATYWILILVKDETIGVAAESTTFTWRFQTGLAYGPLPNPAPSTTAATLALGDLYFVTAP